jgi:hypothetical protein
LPALEVLKDAIAKHHPKPELPAQQTTSLGAWRKNVEPLINATGTGEAQAL